MRRNELRTARGFIEALMHNLSDCSWQVEAVVTPRISVDGNTATYMRKSWKWQGDKRVEVECESCTFKARDFDPEPFAKVFGWQECHFEDSYGGQILFPLEGSDEYLLVNFNA